VISGHEIGPELIEARIGLAVDVVATGAVMDIGRPGQGHLGRCSRDRFQHREILRVAVAAPVDAAHDARDAPRRAMAVRVRFAPAFLFGQLDVDALDAAGGEAVGIRAAAELAVGHDLQADRLLLGHNGADRFVLDRPQPRGIDLAGIEIGASRNDGRGTDEAANLIGAERRVLNAGHWRQAF
jgi:hypothetical protein